VLALGAGLAGAQTPAVTSDISVTLVEVPVEVTRAGEPVKGLTAADFEVLGGQRSLPIVAFETVDLEAPVAPGAPPPPPAARRHLLFLFDFALSQPQRLQSGIAAARELVAKGLDPRDMTAVGLYLPTGELQLLLSFTTDRAAATRTLTGLEDLLTGKIPDKANASDPLRLTGLNARSLLTQVWRVDERNFAGEMLESLGPDPGRWGAFLQRNVLAHSAVLHEASVEERRRSHVIALADAVEGLAEVLRPVTGRKYLALFSEGFAMSLASRPSGSVGRPNIGGSSLLAKLETTLGELQRSGWVLHAVDIAGTRRGSLSADSLFYLANETGGALVEGTNDFAKGLSRAMRRSVHSYLLGVQVDDVPFDGSYHKLEVRLRNGGGRGIKLHHRGGYFAPLPFSRQEDVRRLAEAARLVAGDEESDDLKVEVVAVPLRAGPESTPVAVLVEVPGERLLAAGGAPRLGLEVYGYGLDEAGSSRDFFAQSVDLDPSKVGSRLAQGGVRVLGRLDLPPGEHRLRVLVRDRGDGRTSLLSLPLKLAAAGAEPEERIDALFLPPAGDPWVLVRPAHPAHPAHPANAAFDLHGRSVLPAAQAVLPAAGEAQLLVVGHGLTGEEAVLRGRILDAQGKPASGGEVELLAVTPGESGEPDLAVGRLKAGSLPPGSYLLELHLGKQSRTRTVTARPFRVSAAAAQAQPPGQGR
jgi:VWFA-related protein